MSRLWVSAMEASGDRLAARLLADFVTSSIDVIGFGGEGLRARFPRLRAPPPAAMGVIDISRDLARWLSILTSAGPLRADAALLVDSPALHGPLATRLSRSGVPVFALGAPSIWAYRPERGLRFARAVREVWLPFAFEAPAWRAIGAKVRIVGHPAADHAPSGTESTGERATIAIVPGSRRGELERIGPILAEAARRLPDRRFVVPRAPGVDLGPLLHAMHGLDVEIMEGTHAVAEAGARAWVAWTASGTATLELALAGCPMAIVHRVDALAAALFARMATTSRVGLPNLLAGRDLVPELLQQRARSGAVVEWTRLMDDAALRERSGRRLRALAPLARGPDRAAALCALRATLGS